MKLVTTLRQKLKGWGPGIITGASDDDPSGILTYLQAGTVAGFKLLWTTLITIPLMYCIQEMCARIGVVTDRGLARLLKDRYPRYLVYPMLLAAILVMVLNIGADMVAIGTIFSEWLGAEAGWWALLVAAALLFFLIHYSYPRIAKVLRWLTVSLALFVLTVFFMRINWLAALRATFMPNWELEPTYLLLVAAILGTTISPYLFFWQAAEEVEERDEYVKKRKLRRFLVTKHELKNMEADIFSGMLISNLVMWFMIAGAGHLAATRGMEQISSFSQAAEVLAPLLGPAAFVAFGIGIVGTGLLAVPVLAGSVGYGLAELFGWQEGMSRPFREAKGFYAAIIAATLMGLVLGFVGIDPINLLIYTTLAYALITPPLLLLTLGLANNHKLMGNHRNGSVSNTLGFLAFLLMSVAAVLYLVYA